MVTVALTGKLNVRGAAKLLAEPQEIFESVKAADNKFREVKESLETVTG